MVRKEMRPLRLLSAAILFRLQPQSMTFAPNVGRGPHSVIVRKLCVRKKQNKTKKIGYAARVEISRIVAE